MSNISRTATGQPFVSTDARTTSAVLDFPVRPRRRRASKAVATSDASAEIIELGARGEQNRRKRIERTQCSVVRAALDAKEAVCAAVLFLDADGTAHYVLTGIEPEFAEALIPTMARVQVALCRHAAKAEAYGE